MATAISDNKRNSKDDIGAAAVKSATAAKSPPGNKLSTQALC